MDDKRSQLLEKLKRGNCFWSFDTTKVNTISDESLIEMVMLYLDIDDVNALMKLFGKKKVKQVWMHRIAPLGDAFRPVNVLYAWYYFDAKHPESYIKSLETRHLNRLLSA